MIMSFMGVNKHIHEENSGYGELTFFGKNVIITKDYIM